MSRSRQFPRYALEAAVTMTVGDQTISGRTSNLSRGGLCAMVPAFVPVGARVRAELALVFDTDSYSEPLTLSARVVWCTAVEQRFQVGLAFGALPADAQKYLELFLKFLDEGAQARRAPASGSSDPFES